METRDPADSSDDDSEHGELAALMAEIEAGRMAFDDAIRDRPTLEPGLRQLHAMKNLLGAAKEEIPEKLGEFQIVGVLGKGGMGVVYRAYHPRLKREVAVKTIRHDYASERARERFFREQFALAKLHQTNIVPIYAAGTDGAVEFFVMPFIEGATLHGVIELLRNHPPSSDSSSSDSLSALVPVVRGKVRGEPSTRTAPLSKEVAPKKEKCEMPPSPRKPAGAAYWKSAASAIAAAADALEHAHRRQVFHRDLKPNNLMLSEDGRIWIIDFGLAAFRPNESAEPVQVNGTGNEAFTVGAIGTWTYMAPEQFRQAADARTDVWGLGVTLYELLTLNRAFAHRSTSEVEQAVAAASPPHPLEVVPRMPRDLAEVCWKAMARDPNSRYQTAGELAADLRRWIADEEVAARPRGVPERVLRWTSKHRGWTFAAGLMLFTVFSIISLLGYAAVKSRAELAEKRRQSILHDVDVKLHRQKIVGWSREVVAGIRKAAEIRVDPDLRDSAVAAFAGMDLTQNFRTESFGASSAAYDPAGRRLVLGGLEDRAGRKVSPARVWNLDEAEPRDGKAEGAGVVAFRKDGRAVQLTADATGSVRLLDVVSGESLREFPGLGGGKRAEAPNTALSDSAEFAAASFPDENATLLWTGAGEPHRLAVGGTAMAFSRDATLLAVGDANGRVAILSTRDGKRLASFTAVEHTVQAVAFSRGATATFVGGRTVLDGAIAAGSFGRYVVTRLESSRPYCYFQSRDFECKHLAFLPDDSLILADGIFFDAATGESLLTLEGRFEALAVADDGSEICFGSRGDFSIPQFVRFQPSGGRFATMLHGLRTTAAILAFSQDGSTVAALSRDWQIGVWNVETGRLLRIVELPEGPFADNAAVVLSTDGSLAAAASGEAARLWNVRSGEMLREWKLPPGLSCELAFPRKDELILVRVELKSKNGWPASSHRFPQHPRSIRGRNLLAAKPLEPLFESDLLPQHVFGIALSPEGSTFVIDGLRGDGARFVHVLGARDGRTLASQELTHKRNYRSVQSDPLGKTLAYLGEHNPARMNLLDAATGAPAATIDGGVRTLGPMGKLRISDKAVATRAIPAVFRSHESEPLFSFADLPFGSVYRFSPDGKHLAFETSTGAVGIFDLNRVEDELRRMGIGW